MTVAHQNVTIITTGNRSRLKEGSYSEVARIPGTVKPKSMDDLIKAWEAAVTKVKQEHFVLGAGQPGIYSEKFAGRSSVLASLDNIWCPSVGLGMVNLSAQYPQYDLGEGEKNIRLLVQGETVASDTHKWWASVCALSGASMKSVILGAVKKEHRVIVAMPGIQLYQYKSDLNDLVKALSGKGDADANLANARQYIRFIGPGLDGSVLPAKLTPCAMSYNKEAVDRLVPGSKAHGFKRAMALFLDVCPPSKNGKSDPIADDQKMLAAYKDKSRAPIEFDMGTGGGGESISDEELLKITPKYARDYGDNPKKIARAMREDGVAVSAKRIEELMHEAVKSVKKKAKATAE